jgi:hypothetical protein
MRFKATPFTHPEYEALRKRSEFWANVWLLGHAFFVLYSAIACAAPAIVTAVVLIDPDTLRGRAWDVGGGIMLACGMIAGLGFAVRQYARRKGSNASSNRA